MKINYKYIVIGLIAVIVYLLIAPSKVIKPIYDNSENKQLRDSIEVLNTNLSKLDTLADSIAEITDTLYIELTKVKLIHDTVRIIEVQESIITVQKEEIITLRQKSDVKDLIIIQNDNLNLNLLKSKDREIEDLKKMVKKEKRERILTIIGAGIITGLVIISSL